MPNEIKQADELNKLILILLMVKPETGEKINIISDICQMTKSDLIERIFEGFDNRYFAGLRK